MQIDTQNTFPRIPFTLSSTHTTSLITPAALQTVRSFNFLHTHTQTHTYHNSNYIIRIQYNMHHFHQMFSWIVVWWISALIMMDVCVSYPLWRRGKTRKQRRINYLLLFERQFLTEFCLIYLSWCKWEFWISPLANSKEDSIQTTVFYMNETQFHLESNLSFGKFMWLKNPEKKKEILACKIYYV